MRLDVFLTENEYADSRQRAKLLITEGLVTVNGKVASKASIDVSDADDIAVGSDPIGYVSRGALKLKAAFENFDFESADITEYLPANMKCETAKDGYISLTPERYATDGFFIAKFIKKGE